MVELKFPINPFIFCSVAKRVGYYREFYDGFIKIFMICTRCVAGFKYVVVTVFSKNKS